MSSSTPEVPAKKRRMTDRFLDTMPTYKGQNWFAHLTYIRPHSPFVAPAPFNTMYDPNNLPLPERFNTVAEEIEVHPFMGPAMDHKPISSNVRGFGDLAATDEIVQSMRAVYCGLISEVDFHLGRVISFLKDSGQYDNTLIVLTSDHGEMLGDRHTWNKFSVHDAAYHVPLIIRDPDNESNAGMVVTDPTESIDLAPTILDWVGANAPNSMDGRSLCPLLRGQTGDDWRTYTFSELDFSQPESPTSWEIALGTGPSDSSLAILREERFTLVEFAADIPPILFDHAGRGEETNVAGIPDYQSDLNRLTRLMLRHRMKNMDHTLSLDTITDSGPIRVQRRPG